jgi:zinc finger protein
VPRTTIEEAICPSCDGRGLEYTTEPVDLPYLGKSLQILLRCLVCGYRHHDFVLTEHREPTRYTYTISKAEDMSVRVVRSSSGTVRIPELGISIEPGIASEAFVSNIEGILVRVERILAQLLRDAESVEIRRKVTDLMETLTAMRDGKADPVTVILEDPFGNSAIIGEGAMHERIPEAEADQLKTGMLVYDSSGDLGGPFDQPN